MPDSRELGILEYALKLCNDLQVRYDYNTTSSYGFVHSTPMMFCMNNINFLSTRNEFQSFTSQNFKLFKYGLIVAYGLNDRYIFVLLQKYKFLKIPEAIIVLKIFFELGRQLNTKHKIRNI